MRAGIFLYNTLPVWREKAGALVRMRENPFPYASSTIYFKVLKNHPGAKGLCCSAGSYSSSATKAPRVKFTCSFGKLFTWDALVGKRHKSMHISYSSLIWLGRRGGHQLQFGRGWVFTRLFHSLRSGGVTGLFSASSPSRHLPDMGEAEPAEAQQVCSQTKGTNSLPALNPKSRHP